MKLAGAIDFNAPATDYARKDFPLLQAGASAENALETIRREGVGERVIYFYAVDERMAVGRRGPDAAFAHGRSGHAIA
jgi:hypothetical protein